MKGGGATRSVPMWSVLLVCAAMLAGCSGQGDDDDPSVGAASPADTGPADELAPSQLTTETVPRPETPPPCVPNDVEVATVEVSTVRTGRATATIVFDNVGDVWCETDLGASDAVDPQMEPDVWLEPGGSAALTVDLTIGASSRECEAAEGVSGLPIAINGEPRVVPIEEGSICEWTLSAFAPVDEPAG